MTAIADLREAGIFRDPREGGALRIRTDDTVIEPIYVVILKGQRVPTDVEIRAAIQFFAGIGRLEFPGSNARIGAWYDAEMPTHGIDGGFLVRLGAALLSRYPELKNYITVTGDRFDSTGLVINIVGSESASGYVRVVHLKPE